MWKTQGSVWAQNGPFMHILPPKTADIHCAAMDLTLFRKPELAPQCDPADPRGPNLNSPDGPRPAIHSVRAEAGWSTPAARDGMTWASA
jgi:hypothetical protein